MSNEVLAAAFRKIGEGFYEAADVLFQGGDTTRTESGVVAAPVASGAEFPPFEPTEYEAVPLPADSPGLGRCPTHGTAWTVKAAGVSKAGKPYNSFYKCDGKDQDGAFCQKKPTRAWAEAHPIA